MMCIKSIVVIFLLPWMTSGLSGVPRLSANNTSEPKPDPLFDGSKMKRCLEWPCVWQAICTVKRIQNLTETGVFNITMSRFFSGWRKKPTSEKYVGFRNFHALHLQFGLQFRVDQSLYGLFKMKKGIRVQWLPGRKMGEEKMTFAGTFDWSQTYKDEMDKNLMKLVVAQGNVTYVNRYDEVISRRRLRGQLDNELDHNLDEFAVQHHVEIHGRRLDELDHNLDEFAAKHHVEVDGRRLQFVGYVAKQLGKKLVKESAKEALRHELTKPVKDLQAETLKPPSERERRAAGQQSNGIASMVFTMTEERGADTWYHENATTFTENYGVLSADEEHRRGNRARGETKFFHRKKSKLWQLQQDYKNIANVEFSTWNKKGWTSIPLDWMSVLKYEIRKGIFETPQTIANEIKGGHFKEGMKAMFGFVKKHVFQMEDKGDTRRPKRPKVNQKVRTILAFGLKEVRINGDSKLCNPTSCPVIALFRIAFMRRIIEMEFLFTMDLQRPMGLSTAFAQWKPLKDYIAKIAGGRMVYIKEKDDQKCRDILKRKYRYGKDYDQCVKKYGPELPDRSYEQGEVLSNGVMPFKAPKKKEKKKPEGRKKGLFKKAAGWIEKGFSKGKQFIYDVYNGELGKKAPPPRYAKFDDEKNAREPNYAKFDSFEAAANAAK